MGNQRNNDSSSQPLVAITEALQGIVARWVKGTICVAGVTVALLLGIQSSAHGQSGTINTCDAGRRAFQSSVFSLIQERSACVNCHAGSNPRAPAWSVPDVDLSYIRTKAYVDFSAVGQSTLLVRAGNGHCGPSCRNQAFINELRAKVEEWWNQGEADCEAYRESSPATVPANLSTSGFTPIVWPLSPMDPSLNDIEMVAEIKGIAGATTGSIASYVIRNPKVRATRTEVGCLHIRKIRIKVGSSWQWFANGFETIDAAVNLTQLTGGGFLLLEGSTTLESAAFPDNLSVGFKEVSLVPGTPCP